MASRFLLNYDLVLLALFADALSGDEGQVQYEKCIANPVTRQPTLYGTDGLQLAADSLILLSYYALVDDIQDEKFAKRLLYRLAYPVLRHAHKKAAVSEPALDDILKEQMRRQRQIEKENTALVDKACDPTALMCAALFEKAAQTESQKPILRRMGLFCGQIVYLLDAAEDYEQDKKQRRYNVFLQADLTKDEAVEITKTRCRMAAGEIALSYNLLELKQHKAILDNIIYLGLPAAIEAAGGKQNERRAETLT